MICENVFHDFKDAVASLSYDPAKYWERSPLFGPDNRDSNTMVERAYKEIKILQQILTKYGFDYTSGDNVQELSELYRECARRRFIGSTTYAWVRRKDRKLVKVMADRILEMYTFRELVKELDENGIEQWRARVEKLSLED